MSSFEFQRFDPKQHKLPFEIRDGETRIGQRIAEQNLTAAQYVLIGISEHVGPQANFGRSGSEHAFTAFSSVFFNTQFYAESPLKQLAFLGQITQCKAPLDRPEAAVMVEELDALLYEVLSTQLAPHQIPIIVGGGHNNALALMRWAASIGKLSVVNIDAHADLRPTTQRHSGNSFSFALQEGLLEKYAVFGLHEAYNNAAIRTQLDTPQITHRFYEEYLNGPYTLYDDVLEFFEQQQHRVGIEIDMDAIAMMPSSAFSPSGWSLDQMRGLLLRLGKQHSKIAYLNLTEAGPTDDKEHLVVGKALSYLVRDFVH